MERLEASFFAHSPAAAQWQKVGVRHHHGINIPLFSLHTDHSSGIGEYLDLLPLIQWSASIGLDVIQLLPLNDTGLDASPYGAISAFALNPVHLRLNALPYLEEFPALENALKILPKHPRHVRIHYPQVRETKEHFLRLYFSLARTQLAESPDYHQFIQRSPWVKGYALFKSIKVHRQWANWESWPEELQHPSQDKLEDLVYQYQEEVDWHCILQYLCNLQLRRVKEYADAHGVHLMGDIPILINRDSADVWLHRDLFRLQYSAGAPPDYFSHEGQNWGFPVYNWDLIAKHGYKWWIDRLKVTSHYYDIYRLDHIVGFFRIWAIPLGVAGREGHYIPHNPDTWIDHGQKLLMMMLDHCPMLPIGEDLGVVPPKVRLCMQALGICGTKVMRWERAWETSKEFISVQDYSMASMTTVSTHDNEPLQLWWQRQTEEAMAFAQFKGWTYHPTLSRDYQREILWDSHHSNSLFHINLLQEYLALIPGMTWPDLEDERINIPGLHSDRNWSYRLRPSIEEIINNSSLKRVIQEMIV